MKRNMVQAYQLFILLVVVTLLSSACVNTTINKAQTEKEEVIASEEVALDQSNNNNYPISLKVYTNEGEEIAQTIEKEPQRVVVIGETMAELMIEFGKEEKIVGVAYLNQSFSKYSEQISKLPMISESWPSKEAVLALQPDLIVSISSAFKEELLGDISFWNERNIPVLSAVNFTVGRSIDEYMGEIKNFGIALDAVNLTEHYIHEQRVKINEIKKIAENAMAKPKVLLVGSARDTFYYYPPEWCIIDEMIEGADGEYMKLSEDGYMELSIEAIIKANPEKIIITEFQELDPEVIRNKLLINPQLQNVDAIKNGHVLAAEYTTTINGGLELVPLYEEVAKFIQPDLFGGE